MVRRLLLVACLLWPALGRAGPIGFIDAVSAAGVSGWACVPSGGTPVSIAAVAGDRLLGVFPENSVRTDVARLCGSGAAGFTVGFDRATQDQLAGEPSLSFFAMAPGFPPLPLQGSNPAAFQPYPLPQGSLAVVAANQVLGTFAGPKPPRLWVYEGAPAADGGLAGGPAVTGSAPGGLNFSVPLPAFTPAPGAALPLFGYGIDAAGAPVPLQRPLPAVPGSGSVPIGGIAAESGAGSGIHNMLFTAWVPAGQGFAGLSGQVSLAGNANGFSEALALLGTTGDGQAACQRQNGLWVQAPPAIARLWAGILKNTGAATVTIPVNFALPYPVPPRTSAGSCAMLLISAGYAYLSQNAALYTRTAAALTMATAPVGAGAPAVVPLGLGGEFRIAAGTVSPLSVYVGIEAQTSLYLEGIAGTLSAAPVLGAPASSGWLPLPAGNWAYKTDFLYLPAAACAAAGFAPQPPNPLFAILRNANPQAMPVPAGAVPLMRVTLASLGALPIQKSSYQALDATVPGGLPFRLEKGDCLLGLGSTVPSAGALPGVLDVEDQSTVYLRPLE